MALESINFPRGGSQPGSVWLLSLLFCFLLITIPAFSQKAWEISDFRDTIGVGQNGSIVVSERISLDFRGEWHGIHRTIPVEYPGPKGTNYTLFVDVTNITDGEGHKLKYESHISRGFRDLKIYIPDATDTTKVVQIDYSVRDAIRFFDNYDEFYWNVTGNDWPVPIQHASAFIHFPDKGTGALRAQAFTGVYGTVGHEATAEVKGSNATFDTTSPLPMRGGLTIDVYLPKGILAEPSALSRVMWFLGSNPAIFLPFVTAGVMFVLWWYKGRDPDPGRSIAPMYEPPPGISPAEAGTLIDDTIHPRDITCTLVDLAVRGYVKIEESVDKGLIFHHKDYVFHLSRPREQWSVLAPHERIMLENIYAGGGDETRLSSLKNHFYTAVPLIREEIMSSLKNKGMYLLDPESANGYNFLAVIVILAPFALAQYTGYKDFFSSISTLVISVLISGLIWWLFAREMSAKTMKGGRTRVEILGFQEFMQRVDADRLKRMPPDTFEKYLPYAMALGVEQIWARKFEGLLKDPPQWFVSPNGMLFNPILFSTNMHALSNDMHQVFVSAPRSSSSGSGWSGGGGGGGFSGGGFGGGGGSAF